MSHAGIEFRVEEALDAQEFLELAQRVWPGAYDRERTQEALGRTMNITARHDGALVGCVRVLSDGYYFGTVPEIMVHPQYRGRGVGRRLMMMAWERSPTSLFFGAQAGNEGFFEKLGFEQGMTSFAREKARTPRRGERE